MRWHWYWECMQSAVQCMTWLCVGFCNAVLTTLRPGSHAWLFSLLNCLQTCQGPCVANLHRWSEGQFRYVRVQTAADNDHTVDMYPLTKFDDRLQTVYSTTLTMTYWTGRKPWWLKYSWINCDARSPKATEYNLLYDGLRPTVFTCCIPSQVSNQWTKMFLGCDMTN